MFWGLLDVGVLQGVSGLLVGSLDHGLAHDGALVHVLFHVEVGWVGENVPHLVAVIPASVMSDDVLLKKFELLFLHLAHILHLDHVHALDLKNTALAVFWVRLLNCPLVTLKLECMHGRPLIPVVVLAAGPPFTNHLKR